MIERTNVGVGFIRNTRGFKDFLNGTLRKPLTPEGYAGWRATIRWTDEEIAAALEELATEIEPSAHRKHEAELLRKHAVYLRQTGRLTMQILRGALPMLSKACNICGKKALYRTGDEGRCSKHRDVPAAAVIAKNERLGLRAKEQQRNRARRDDRDIQTGTLKQCARGHRR